MSTCPGQSSTTLKVLCPFSYCIVANYRLMSLLQRYIILLFSSVLPVSNSSLLVHSTSKPVFLPGHQLRSANRLLRTIREKTLFRGPVPGLHLWLGQHWAQLIKAMLKQWGFFSSRGWCKHDLSNTREFMLRESRFLKTFTCYAITSLHWACQRVLVI